MNDIIPSPPLTICVGVPGEALAAKLAESLKRGGSIIYFVHASHVEPLMLPYPGPQGRLIRWRADSDLREFLFKDGAQFIGAAIEGEDEPSVRSFAELLGNVLKLHKFDTDSATTLNKDGLTLRNAYWNAHWIKNGLPLRRLKGASKGRPGIIIAAGPSLNAQWDQLKRLRAIREPQPVCIFVVGRSYTLAMRQGVEPDFVVEAEQYAESDRIFVWAKPPPPGTILAAPVQVAPAILRDWPLGNERVILTDHAFGDNLGLKVGEDTIDGGNSVAHLAFNLAWWTGCDPICFAGIDFGYPNGTNEDTHALGTIHGAWAPDVVRCELAHQSGAQVIANDGSMIDSSPAYVNFRTLMEIQVAKAKRENPALRVVTFSPRGARIDGAEYTPISEFLCPKPPPPSSEPPPPSTPPSGSSPPPSAPECGSPACVSANSSVQPTTP